MGKPDVSKMELVEELQKTIDKIDGEIDVLTSALKGKKQIKAETEKKKTLLIQLGESALKEQTALFADIETAEGNRATKAAAKAKKDSKAAKAPAAQVGAKPPGKEKANWQRPIKDVITLGSVVNALETLPSPINTLGDCKRWLEKNKFTDLPGVGVDKAAKAADQMAEFYKAHPEYVA